MADGDDEGMRVVLGAGVSGLPLSDGSDGWQRYPRASAQQQQQQQQHPLVQPVPAGSLEVQLLSLDSPATEAE